MRWLQMPCSGSSLISSTPHPSAFPFVYSPIVFSTSSHSSFRSLVNPLFHLLILFFGRISKRSRSLTYSQDLRSRHIRAPLPLLRPHLTTLHPSRPRPLIHAISSSSSSNNSNPLPLFRSLTLLLLHHHHHQTINSLHIPQSPPTHSINPQLRPTRLRTRTDSLRIRLRINIPQDLDTTMHITLAPAESAAAMDARGSSESG